MLSLSRNWCTSKILPTRKVEPTGSTASPPIRSSSTNVPLVEFKSTTWSSSSFSITTQWFREICESLSTTSADCPRPIFNPSGPITYCISGTSALGCSSQWDCAVLLRQLINWVGWYSSSSSST